MIWLGGVPYVAKNKGLDCWIACINDGELVNVLLMNIGYNFEASVVH